MPSNPQKDLEDFASGIYPGTLSPQQGRLLPPAAQGGLPFGASPMPPRPPAPGPAFQAPSQALPQAPQAPPAPMQRATLMQLGGQAPDVNQMIAERLQSLQRINPARSKYSEAVKYYNALEELPKLTGIANIRSQDRQLQQGYLKESAQQLEKFNALPPEQQATMRPFMSAYLKNTSKLAGMDLSDADVTHALTSPDLSATYSSITGDPLVSEQARTGYLSRIGAAKPGKERDDASALVRKELDDRK